MHQIIRKAFTLIELLVVIAIIGILSGLIVVSMGGMTTKASSAKSQVFSNSLRNSLMLNTVAQYLFDDIDVSDYDPSTKIVNNDAGNIPDSWTDNEGRAYNGPTLKDGSDCVLGKCLSFDGADDYISATDSSTLNFGSGSFTFLLWAKSNMFKSQGTIILKKASYVFNNTPGWGIQYASSPQKIYVGVANGSARIEYNTDLTSFDWMLMGISRMDDNRVYFIKNGALILLGTLAGDVNNTANLLLGGGWAPFSGSIDDVRIYNAALPTSQIKEQYYAGLNSLLASGQIDEKDYGERINLIANE